METMRNQAMQRGSPGRRILRDLAALSIAALAGAGCEEKPGPGEPDLSGPVSTLVVEVAPVIEKDGRPHEGARRRVRKASFAPSGAVQSDTPGPAAFGERILPLQDERGKAAGKVLLETTPLGVPNRWKFYHADGHLFGVIDQNGARGLDERNELAASHTFAVGKGGTATLEATYDRRPFFKGIYIEDLQGRPLEETTYGLDRRFEGRFLYRYVFDRQGNWTQRTKVSVGEDAPPESGKPVEILYRTLQYR